MSVNIRIDRIEAFDVRFPTSRWLEGSDAMNPDPDYSAAYVVIRSNLEGLEGHGFTFTIGRGNELCVAAIRAMTPMLPRQAGRCGRAGYSLPRCRPGS